jgi:hypothetical protein
MDWVVVGAGPDMMEVGAEVAKSGPSVAGGEPHATSNAEAKTDVFTARVQLDHQFDH